MKKDILIIDESSEDRTLCRMILEKAGYSIDEAPNLNSIKNDLEDRKINYSIIITDIDMLETGVKKMTNYLKTNHPAADIIVMSTIKGKDSALEAVKQGAAQYLTKPFNSKELKLAVEKVLQENYFRKETGHLDNLIALHRAARAMVSDKSLESILEFILDMAVATVRADGGSIMLVDKNTGDYVIRCAAGTFEDIVVGKHFKAGERVAGRAIKMKSSILVDSETKKEAWFKKMKQYEYIRSGMSVPLIIGENVLGVINLKRTHTDEEFVQREVDVVEILAADSAISLENHELKYQKKSL